MLLGYAGAIVKMTITAMECVTLKRFMVAHIPIRQLMMLQRQPMMDLVSFT
jgi:hypothetical protein